MENQSAGRVFGKCFKKPAYHTDSDKETPDEGRSPQIRYIDMRVVFTRQQLTMELPESDNPGDDDGLGANACWLLSHPSAALTQGERASQPNYQRTWVDIASVVAIETNRAV